MNMSFIGLDKKRVIFIDFKMHSITELSEDCCELAFFDAFSKLDSGLSYFKINKGCDEMVKIYERIIKGEKIFDYSLEIKE